MNEAVSGDGVPLAQARLAELVGLAPSPVLTRRLQRVRPLVAQLQGRPSHLDDPVWAELLDAVTVPETRMFRAAAQLEALRSAVLPGLARCGTLRLVSAGCATGEEAWTLAILAAGVTGRWRVEGLDLSRPALLAATRATYHRGPPDALREVPARDLPALDLTETGFAPRAALRDGVRFRRANLLDPGLPAEEADVILCRNVLIYLTQPARSQVLRQLRAALRPGGVLVLGATDRPPAELGLVPILDPALGIWQPNGGRADG
jgi:chemotaxis protein methyltransferase CheR